MLSQTKFWRLGLIFSFILGMGLVGRPEATSRAQSGRRITAQNAANLVELHRFGQGWITDLAWASDSRQLAIGGSLGVWIYNRIDFKRPPLHLDTASQPINALVFSPSAQTVVGVSQDGSAYVWNTRSGEVVYTTPPTPFSMNAVTFNTDGSRLAIGNSAGTVQILDTTTWAVLVQIQVGASSNPYPLAFNPAGDILATGARGISLWQVESGQPIISFPVTGFVRSLQFLPDGATLVSSGTDGFVRVWDMATNTEKTQLQITGVGTPRLIDAVLQPDGKFLISVERDTDNLARWDGQAGSTPTFYQAQVGMVLQSSLSPDGDVVAVAGSQQVVALYNQLGTDPMAILDGFTAPVLGVEFGPNATEVYTSHEDGSLARWSAENGRFINKIMLRAGQQRPNTDSLLMTERYVIVRGFNTVLVYTLDLGIKRFELNATGNLTSAGTTTPTRFILNNDDSLLVVGSALNHIVIWELTNGSLVGQLRGHRAAITDIRFGAGDNFLLTASADGSARLWGLP